MAASNARTGKPLSASTVHATLAALKAFFVWLVDQPGSASRIKYADAEYFSAPDNLSRIATARRFKTCPTLAQIRTTIDSMPEETEIERRDRALIAFAILSGARDKAVISFRLKHIDTERGLIEQDSGEVRTKLANTFTTWFFPVGDDVREIFVEWVLFLREEKGFGPDDPLFQKTKVTPGEDLAFRAVSLDRAPWANANHVRKIFREALCASGIPLFQIRTCCGIRLFSSPTIGKLDAEAFKAWSQNIGHESCLTTFSRYGTIPPARQAEIIRRLAVHDEFGDVSSQAEMLRKLPDQMRHLYQQKTVARRGGC